MIEADIAITDNADWALPLFFTDGNDAPYDFTGDSFKMDVRETPASAPVAQLTTANGGIDSTDLANGHVTLHLAKGLTAGTYVYDLIRVTGAAQEYLIGGKLTVRQGVTA